MKDEEKTQAQLVGELSELRQRVAELTGPEAERNGMTQSLEEEAIRRRILFEESPDGILTIDPPTGRFVEFNTAAHEHLGYSREEFARLAVPDAYFGAKLPVNSVESCH